jgi:hypothetical protein
MGHSGNVASMKIDCYPKVGAMSSGSHPLVSG